MIFLEPIVPEVWVKEYARACGWAPEVLLSIWMGGDPHGTFLDEELTTLHEIVDSSNRCLWCP